MKTSFASALLALTLTASVPAFATISNPVPTTDPASESALFNSILRALPGGDLLEVSVSNPQGKKLTIRLLDASGETLAIQFLGKQPQTSRLRFDLAAVPSGTYRVEIASGSTRQIKEFTLAEPQALVQPVRTVVVG